MLFNDYRENAWAMHASDPKKVAEEFKQNFNLIKTEDDLLELAQLIVHVCGEHLGDWVKGVELLRKLKNNPAIKDQSELNRCVAILNLGNNPSTSISQFSPSDQAIIFSSTAFALLKLGGLKNAEKLLKLASPIINDLLESDDCAHEIISKKLTGLNSEQKEWAQIRLSKI